jgi:glycosyltransferase involved in cell wall biosynthesis
VTVSECARSDISKAFRVPSERFRVVPNGIDTKLFYPRPEVERAPNRILVTNSADTPLKGLRYLLLALADLRKERELELVVVGTPKKNGAVIRLIRTLGIGDQVHFTGHIEHDEFVRQYARATVAVVPSVYEGFGLPAGEAMACGVPVISTTGGALPEVVGDAGILVPPADPAALRTALVRAMDHPEEATELGRRGQERVHKLFTWRRAAEKTVEVYREAIRDHRQVH